MERSTTPSELARAGAEQLSRYRELEAAGLDGVAEVQASLEFLRKAVSVVSNPTELPAYQYNLALALQSRYDALGESAGDDTDLREAIALLDRAVAATDATNSPYEATLKYALGAALRRRYYVAREAGELRRAIGLLGDALMIGTPDSLDVADCQYEYGRGLLSLADIDQNDHLLDESIRALHELVMAVESDNPDRSTYLDALGSARLARYDRLGDEDDLAGAIAMAREAVGVGRERRDLSVEALTNLANALVSSGIRRAVVNPDLEEAEAIAREALTIARERARRREPSLRLINDQLAGIESNLAGILLAQVERTNDLGPLDEAVQLCEEAVDRSYPDRAELGARAHQLAIALRTRFLRGGDAADLDAAVAAHQRALAGPASLFERPTLLDSWANTLRTRFDHTADVADLRAAISIYEQARDAPGTVARDRAGRLNNLGSALTTLAEATKDADIGDRAQAILDEAVRDSESGSLERSRALINLGNALAEQYGRRGRPEDRDAAVAAFTEVQHSADLRTTSTESVLQAALNAGDWAIERGDWSDAVGWLGRALEAVEELVVVQRRRSDKESWLRSAQGASIRAAAAALRLDDPAGAATLLERGRALLTREAIQQIDIDLDALDAAGAHSLRRQLDAAGQTNPWSEGSLTARRSTTEPAFGDLRQLRDEIRKVPGFQSFLAAPTFEDVAAAASPTPLVYLASTGTGGFALVVRGRTVTSINLPDLTDDAVQTWVSAVLSDEESFVSASAADRRPAQDRRARTFVEVSEWLWDTAAGALAAELSGGPASVVTGGLLSLLPLHAASRPDITAASGRRYLIDDALVSYTPNALARRAAVARSGLAADRLLAVAQPQPSDLISLPGTLAEAACAQAGFSQSVVLPGRHATATAVADALPDCDVAHLGCHGIADLRSPLTSAVLLADDIRFSLADILARKVRLRLAVLSACETAQPGTALPDEVVSLPAGLMQAGAAGVIATGWAVPDVPSAALMAEFYRRWRHAGEDPARALAGAQVWLRDTTNGEKVDAWNLAVECGAPWLPLAAADILLDHYLIREPDAYDDAGVEVWASFAYFGA